MDTIRLSAPATKAKLMALTQPVKGAAVTVCAVPATTTQFRTTTNTNWISNGVAQTAASFSLFTKTPSSCKPTKNFIMPSKFRMLVTSFIVSIITLFAGQAFGQATVTSDKDDYPPLSQAVFRCRISSWGNCDFEGEKSESAV